MSGEHGARLKIEDGRGLLELPAAQAAEKVAS
jgi:hypothetical protein